MQRDPDEILARVGGIARAHGVSAVAEEADALRARIVEGRCYVACVGQFKRGKSTLINALVGSAAVPTGVVPVTSVPLVVRYGPPSARVRFDGTWEAVAPDRVAGLVTETGNPGNVRAVRGAEVFTPSPLLQQGLCLVDTPGLGSTSGANDAATRDVLPRIDAALLVTGPEPPITADELDLASRLTRNGVPFLVVVSKADRMVPADRAVVRKFTRRALDQAGAVARGRVLEVSAIAPPDSEANPDWRALVDAVTRLQVDSGRELLARTLERTAARLTGQLRALFEAESRALAAPLDETSARRQRLELLRDDAWRVAADLGPLLGSELALTGRRLGDERARFLREAAPAASRQLAERLVGVTRRRTALARANELAREHVVPWLREIERLIEAEFRTRSTRFGRSGAQLSEALAREAGVSVPVAVDPMDGMGHRRFQFHDRLRTRGASGSLFDTILPRAWRARRIAAAADAYLADLLEINASRVEGDLVERVAEASAAFERGIRRALDAVVDGARRAEVEAGRVMAEGEAAVAERRQALADALAMLADAPAV
ncbi:MAG: dynamin family protein [Gemmatimonadales bacterium]